LIKAPDSFSSLAVFGGRPRRVETTD